MLMGVLVKQTPCYLYAMASWHIFKQSRLEAFVANRVGGFSIYREGLDRQALETSIEIVTTAERPLMIFPEGVISRANDRLLSLMDGVSFIARAAAKRRVRAGETAPVVIHPVSIRYQLKGDPEETIRGVLDRLESRTFWKSHGHQSIVSRVHQLGQALLAAREIECLGQPQTGSLKHRMGKLIDAVLHPYEEEWLGERRCGDVIARVKDLRSAMLPDLVKGGLPPLERDRRWRQLTDAYYLQCLSLYPPGYLEEGVCGHVSAERIIETVHRLEEDMTDAVTIRPEWHVEINVGAAIEVPANTPRARGGTDPIMDQLRRDMLSLLGVQDWWPPQAAAPATLADVSSRAAPIEAVT